MTLSLGLSNREIPPTYQATFRHLMWDIGWFGVLSGSSIAFLAIFATRQGASIFQIGLLNASPALVSLLFALPAGRWLQDKSINRTVFWTSVAHRFFYLLWVFLPAFLLPSAQVWVIILLVWLMSIPGTALAIGFNTLFAAAVPVQWRSDVVGRRNAFFAMTAIATSLVCGWVLDALPFPLGYQVVFALGFVGAFMSSVHLWFVHPAQAPPETPTWQPRVRHIASPNSLRAREGGTRNFGLRGWRSLNRLSLPDASFGWVVFLLFIFHFTQHAPIALFPIYWVDGIGLSDMVISVGTSIFYLAMFLGSLQTIPFSQRFGNQRIMAIGMILMSLYPIITAFTTEKILFYIVSGIGGLAWSLVVSPLSNYILEEIPEEVSPPAYLAWYSIALNAGILGGSFIGSLLGGWLGLVPALLIAGMGRLLIGVLFWWKKK